MRVGARAAPWPVVCKIVIGEPPLGPGESFPGKCGRPGYPHWLSYWTGPGTLTADVSTGTLRTRDEVRICDDCLSR